MSEYSSTASRPTSPAPPVENPITPRPYRFNWDPSSRRPGPGSVSETTEGRGGDYFASGATVRLDGLLNVSTTSLALGALPPEWSSSRHGFHAISTVLNSPHKRGAPPKAHSPLPAPLQADLPRVRRKDFDSYLQAISEEWDRLERNTARESEASGSRDGTPRTPPATLLPPLDTVPSVFFEPNFDLGDPRTFALVTEQDPTSSNTSDFAESASLSHTLPLLDKFSHYTDTLEAHLAHEISLRSTSFFAALTNLQDLQTESATCLSRISHLRGLLKEVDEGTAKRGAEGVRLEMRKEKMGLVREGVKGVGEVWEMLGITRGLVEAGQWEEALGVVEGLQGLWDADPLASKTLPSLPHENGRLSSLSSIAESDASSRSTSPSPSVPSSKRPAPSVSTIPLSTLQAFAGLPSHLRALTLQIVSSLTSEVVTVLRIDLLSRINATPKTTAGSEGDLNLELKDRLRPLLSGLVRAKRRGPGGRGEDNKSGVEDAIESWREVVLIEVSGAINRRLPAGINLDSNDLQKSTLNAKPVDTGQQSSTLADHLRSNSHTEFVGLLRAIYGSLLSCVDGLQTQNRIIMELLEGMQPRPPSTPLATPRSLPPISSQLVRSSLSDLLMTAAERANTHCGNILGLRSEQNVKLELSEFVDLFHLSWDFVVKCEVICQRMIVSLRGAAVNQAKAFLQTFHQARISQSAKLVEDEQWNHAEVSPAMQHIADLLVDCAVRDPPELQLSHSETPSSLSPSPSLAVNGPTSPMSGTPSQENGTKAAKQLRIEERAAKQLRIEERSYFAVSATLQTLVLLIDYLKLIANLSMLTTDAMSRVIEFLKAFNSRTCQVVLGAGAMRSAGLKNITAKHLALASQSLSIMIALIPYVRETFRRHLSSKQAVMLVEFDKLKRDYQEHQNEIHTKLIAIMGDRLSAHIRTLQAVDWNAPKSPSGVNGYIELLVKETVTLHKVLSRYLSGQIVEYVMTQVFAAINHRLSEEYNKIELPSQDAKDRLLADAKFLQERLSVLKNVGARSGMLETVVSEKSVARNSEPPPSTNNPPGTTANQRIKNMLGRRDSKLLEKEKPLPSPVPALSNGSAESPVNGEVVTPPEKPGFKEIGEEPSTNEASPSPPPMQPGLASTEELAS